MVQILNKICTIVMVRNKNSIQLEKDGVIIPNYSILAKDRVVIPYLEIGMKKR